MKALWRFITFIPRWWLNSIYESLGDDEKELTFTDWLRGIFVLVVSLTIMWLTFMIA